MKSKSLHASEPGFVCSCKNNLTGQENVLYDTGEKPRWNVACIAHAKNSQQKNKKIATSLLKTPEFWCNGCFDLEDLRKAEKMLNDSVDRPDDQKLKMWAKIAQGNPEKCQIFESIYGLKPDSFW